MPPVHILEVIFPNLRRCVQLWFNFGSTLTQLPRCYAPWAQCHSKHQTNVSGGCKQVGTLKRELNEVRMA